jgi:hypothetical protein
MDLAISNPSLATVVVLTMAALMMIQTVGTVYFLVRMRRKVRKLEIRTLTRMQNLEEGMRASGVFLDRAGWVRERIPAFERKLTRVLESVSSSAKKLDENAIRGIAATREKVHEADRMLDYGLHHYARQTNRVHRMVRTPAVHVSAILQGALAAFSHFIADRGRRQPSTHSADSDSFI